MMYRNLKKEKQLAELRNEAYRQADEIGRMLAGLARYLKGSLLAK